MTITIGLVMQLGSYPPAVVVPPLQQPFHSTLPVIEAQKIAAPAAIARTGSPRNNLMQQSNGSAQETALAYTKHAKHIFPKAISGSFLDLFA